MQIDMLTVVVIVKPQLNKHFLTVTITWFIYFLCCELNNKLFLFFCLPFASLLFLSWLSELGCDTYSTFIVVIIKPLQLLKHTHQMSSFSAYVLKALQAAYATTGCWLALLAWVCLTPVKHVMLLEIKSVWNQVHQFTRCLITKTDVIKNTIKL